MRAPLFLYPLMEHELYWLYVLILFVVSFFVGTTVTNFLYRDVSWNSMIKSDYWHYDGMRSTGLEKYLYVVFVISFIVLAVLNCCVTALLNK